MMMMMMMMMMMKSKSDIEIKGKSNVDKEYPIARVKVLFKTEKK